MKKLISLALALVLTFALAVPAGAAETKTADATKAVGVIFNNKALTFPADAQPEIQNGSTMVPLKAFVEALGGKVVATGSSFVITFASGSYAHLKNLTLQPGSNSYMKNGATYIPLSLFAGLTGGDLRWDRASRSAVLIDRQTLVNEINQNFTVLNTALEKNTSDPTKNYKSTATYDITLNLPAQEAGGSAVTGTMKMTMDMISSATAVEMKGTLDASMLASMLDLDGAVKDVTISAAEAAAVRKALSNSTFQMRFDLNVGVLYMNMSLLSALSDGQIPAETWIKLDMKEMLDAMDMGALLGMESEPSTIGDLIYAFVASAATSANGGNATLYDTVKDAAALTTVFFGDKSAKESAGVYQFHIDAAGLNQVTGEQVVNTATDAFAADITVNGSAITVKFDMKTVSASTVPEQKDLTLSFSGTMTMNVDKSNITMTMDMGELGSAKYVLAMTMTPTTQKPVATLPAGAKVVDFNDLLRGMLSPMPTVPATPATPATPAA